MKTILLADDDENILEILREILESKYEIFTAANGREAFELFQSEHFDLLITDLVMPEMTGIDLLTKVKGVRSDFPVIIISGGDGHMLAKARAAKADGFIGKPFELDDVYSECARLLTEVTP